MYGNFFSWKDDLITTHLKKYSAHARNELAMIKSLIGNNDNIIDIGAHIGTYSIPFARFNDGKGKVYAFEANENNYELLKKNISENNLENVITPINKLVSSIDRTYHMMLPEGGNSGMYYFVPLPNPSNGKLNIINIDDWYQDLNKNIKIKLIKIDVEGAEILAIQSCLALIERFKPLLYIEVSVLQLDRFDHSIDDLEKILNLFGYKYFRNIGMRNSSNDSFKIAKLCNLKEGGTFFDLLAIHPTDICYKEVVLRSEGFNS